MHEIPHEIMGYRTTYGYCRFIIRLCIRLCICVTRVKNEDSKVWAGRVSNGFRSTGIIGRASAVRINYRKWVGPSINTIDPAHSEFQVWCSSVAWLWSYSLPKVSPNISKIGQLYVLSDSVPCLFSKATVGKISAALGSSTTLLLHANFS